MLFEKQITGMYRNKMYRRCDDNGTAFYFSADDFPGLQKEGFSFPAAAGHTLQGYFYQYADPRPNRLVVFDHGFGGGHRSYLREIETLCRHGYRVFAYDHTGCMESGGSGCGGLAQSLSDLNDCFTALKAAGHCEGKTLSAMGHSWGGFSTLNIAALHPDIRHIVVISGFVSVELIVKSFFGMLPAPYRRAVLSMERATNPHFVDYNAVETLQGTGARVLLLYSDDDKLCRKSPHFDLLQQGLAGRENTKALLLHGKGHNPNYTADAVQYLARYSADVQKLMKKKRLETAEQKAAFRAAYDWKRMTEQDEEVWAEIFRTLES